MIPREIPIHKFDIKYSQCKLILKPLFGKLFQFPGSKNTKCWIRLFDLVIDITGKRVFILILPN